MKILKPLSHASDMQYYTCAPGLKHCTTIF
jgi:hypothetical protein